MWAGRRLFLKDGGAAESPHRDSGAASAMSYF
jgi:hypothetical protein